MYMRLHDIRRTDLGDHKYVDALQFYMCFLNKTGLQRKLNCLIDEVEEFSKVQLTKNQDEEALAKKSGGTNLEYE